MSAAPVPALEIVAARRRIAGLVRRTPLVRSDWLSRLTAGDVHLKLESLQVGHSFKTRGAVNAVLADSARRAAAGTTPPPLVTASAGNHGRALAYAAARTGRRATIFTPRDAPEVKLAAIRALGADLRAAGKDYEDAERQAKAFAAAEGAMFVSPYSHRDVIAGAGTVALEILEDLPEVDAIVAPVGGGGLISGIAAAVRATNPSSEVTGAEAEASPVFATALREGRITEVAVAPTIADGLAGNLDPASITFELVRDTVHRIVAAPERDLRAAVRGLAFEEHLIAEGAGAAGIAALLAGRIAAGGRTLAIVVSGSNVDAARLTEVLPGP